MRRIVTLFAGLLLTVSLAFAASANGYFRTAHAIQSAGLSTITICARNGSSTITLDRNGAPVDADSLTCTHCADCYLAAAFGVRITSDIFRKVESTRLTVWSVSPEPKAPVRSGLQMPRAPPVQKIKA